MANNNVNIVLKAVDKTKGAFRSVTTGLNAVKKAAFSLQTGLLSVGGVAGMGYLIKQSMNTIDALGKTASKIGIATDALGGLRYAAEQTGVSSNTLDMALQRMVRRVSEAADGTGEAVKALKELNLDAAKLEQLSPDQQFKAIADAMEGVEGQSDKVRLAMRLFDSEGVALVNTLEGGAQAIQNLEDRARALGMTLDDAMVDNVESANDAISTLSGTLRGMFFKVVGELAPLIKGITMDMQQWVELKMQQEGGAAKVARNIAIQVVNATKTIVESFAAVGNSIITLGNIAVTVGNKLASMLGMVTADEARMQIGLLNEEIERMQNMTNTYDPDDPFAVDVQGSDIALLEKKRAKFQEILDLGQAFTPMEQMAPIDVGGTSAMLDELLEKMRGYTAETKAIADTSIAETKDVTAQSYNDLMELQYNYQMMSEGAQAEHQRKMLEQTSHWYRKQAAIQKEAKKGSVMTIEETGRGIASALAGHNKKAFDLNKSFAIKDALVDTYKAVSKAWASAPFPANIAPAAIALAKGYANVQSIRATQFREKGGPITAGSPYVVGERGPELIVPSQSGTVIPNNQLRQAPNVTIQVNTLDATGFEDMLTRSRGALVNALNLGLNDQGKPGLT